MRYNFLDLLSRLFSYFDEREEAGGFNHSRTGGLSPLRLQLILLERHHAAAGMIDDCDFASSERARRKPGMT
jgi:hypothetical protein